MCLQGNIVSISIYQYCLLCQWEFQLFQKLLNYAVWRALNCLCYHLLGRPHDDSDYPTLSKIFDTNMECISLKGGNIWKTLLKVLVLTETQDTHTIRQVLIQDHNKALTGICGLQKCKVCRSFTLVLRKSGFSTVQQWQ